MSNGLVKSVKINILFAWNNSIPQIAGVFKAHVNNISYKINKQEFD